MTAPRGGYGFGPRHIDFHARKPWLYVSDERRSRLYMFRMLDGRAWPRTRFESTDGAKSNPRARPIP